MKLLLWVVGCIGVCIVLLVVGLLLFLQQDNVDACGIIEEQQEFCHTHTFEVARSNYTDTCRDITTFENGWVDCSILMSGFIDVSDCQNFTDEIIKYECLAIFS